MRVLVVLLTLFLAGRAAAQDCATSDDWPDEAARIRRHETLVTRAQKVLRLSLDGGRTLDLVDCAPATPARRYLFERYDQPGRFYVVRTEDADDFFYTLVLMASGRSETAHGMPVWASEKSRYLTVACAIEPARGTLAIRAPTAEGGLATEAEFPLPCDRESCSARWDHESWIAVTCTPREAGGKKGSEFVLMRSNNGQWSKLGR